MFIIWYFLNDLFHKVVPTAKECIVSWWGCNNGRDSYRKTMSNEGGHNCLNNENNINMEVWILNIDVWILNIDSLNIEY